jgi:hypothetical protein
MADSVSQDQQLADGDEEGFFERYWKIQHHVQIQIAIAFH